MKLTIILFTWIVGLLGLPANADTFGTGANMFTIEFVDIRNPGNANDVDNRLNNPGDRGAPYGGVPYTYRIGEFEIPQDAITKATIIGLANVTAGAWSGNRPAANLNWFEAAAFVNWLNASTGHHTAYDLTWSGSAWTMNLWPTVAAWQAGGENRYRHKAAFYFLPSEDEWYKAAFHKNDGVSANYWDYATGSDGIPDGIDFVGDTNFDAVFYDGDANAQPNEVTNVGLPSAYGTFGQAGNVWEWEESAFDGVNDSVSEGRTDGGVGWGGSAYFLQSFIRNGSEPTDDLESIGFRVASVALDPEISVEEPLGNTLVDGGAVRDFGAVIVGNSSTKTFTIRNTGAANLTGLDLSKNGTNPGDFAFSAMSSSGIPVGVSTVTFTVTFTPSVNGPRSAVLHISSNDGDENPFDINLTGGGLTMPEIVVEQPLGTSLDDNEVTRDFGNLNLGSSRLQTFTIRNAGTGPLNGLAVTKDGGHAGDFTLTGLEVTTLAPGVSTSFSVIFTPTGIGTRSAAIHIASDDGDENPFDIGLTGTSTAPEIEVAQPVGTILTDGGTARDFGTVSLGLGAPLSFTIRNTGTGQLSGLAISKNGSHAGDFSVGNLPVVSLASGGSTSFTVTFNPAARGARTAAIHIASDDADENPFDINLTGTGVNPEIAVEQPSGTGLVDGTATVNFGSFNLGTGGPLTFTIRNSGADALTGLAVTKDGSEAGDFTIGTLTATPLAAGGSRTFTVTFNPAAAGPRTAAIHIASNDADENPFDITLTGTGTVPEIDVEQPAGSGLTDGGTSGFGTVNLGSSELLTFTIRNSGTGSMSGLAITKNGTNAADFTVSALGVTTLAAGASKTFTVTSNPTAAGARKAAIQIASNDADENPFDINLTGTGRAVPEIVVQQPAGTGLTDGSAVPVDFGKVTSGTSGSRTFTIRNTGTADLTGIVVTLNGGTAAGDFSIWDLGATSLASGTATTFSVFFLPGGPGARTATLLIASNDEDENPFEIALTGMRATPELDAWRQTYFGSPANSGAGADLSDPDRDGVVNLMEFATGSGPWTANVQPGELVKNESSLEFTWPRRKTALAEIAYNVEWSELLIGPWSAAEVSTAVFTDGSVIQEMKSTLPAGGSGRRFVRLRVTRL